MALSAARRAPRRPTSGSLLEVARPAVASDGQRLSLVEAILPASRPARGAPSFLLLHGFAQNRHSFALGPLPRALLERGARVFLGELRGHGRSRVDTPHPWSLRTHLELDCPALIAGVLRAARVERVHVLGHSMGGLLGCALLAGDSPLASLTTVGTPIVLGAGRPLVRIASLFAGPLGSISLRGRRVPIHRLLAALSRPLSRPDARGPLGLLQRATGLANPAAASPEALEAVLASADPESFAVLGELARNAILARPRVAGVDLVEALRASRLPIAAVVGTRDVFAPRAAVAPMDAPGHAGPRLVVELRGVAHLDIAIGHHVPNTVSRLWEFLLPH